MRALVYNISLNMAISRRRSLGKNKNFTTMVQMKSNIGKTTSIINKRNIDTIRQSDRRIEVTKTLLFF